MEQNRGYLRLYLLEVKLYYWMLKGLYRLKIEPYNSITKIEQIKGLKLNKIKGLKLISPSIKSIF